MNRSSILVDYLNNNDKICYLRIQDSHSANIRKLCRILEGCVIR